MSTDAVTIPLLNDQQSTAILTEALQRRMYEGVQGAIPQDAGVRAQDAQTLVAHALRARAAGNQSDGVNSILFIAQVDMNTSTGEGIPSSAPATPPAAPPATAPTNGGAVPAGAVSSAFAPPTPTQEAAPSVDLSAIDDGMLASMISTMEGYVETPAVTQELNQLRAEQARRQGGTVAQAQTAQQVAPPAAPGAGQAGVPVQAGAGNGGDPAQGQTPPASGAFAAPPDAATQSAAEAPQSSAQGQPPQAQPVAQAGGRAALEAQLTIPILRGHNVDPNKVSDLSDDELLWMLSHPPVGVQAPVEQPVQAPVQAFAPEASVPKTDREALEEQLTGPMLKAYGRGRVDIPIIGNNELALMIAHPDGQISAALLEEAKAKDGAQGTPPVQAAPAFAPVQSAAPPVQTVAPVQTPPPVSQSEGALRAAAIISREHFPVPPEISGDPPVLPQDVSLESDEVLRSLHAQFHACEARGNWVISEIQDELGDIEKLRKGREVAVRNAALEQKPTKDQMEALVAGDPDVVRLRDQEFELQKTINKLKVLRDGWHRDCERLSRQWSFRYFESKDTPRS